MGKISSKSARLRPAMTRSAPAWRLDSRQPSISAEMFLRGSSVATQRKKGFGAGDVGGTGRKWLEAASGTARARAGGPPETDQPRRSPAHTIGFGVVGIWLPCSFAPRREVVNRLNLWGRTEVGYFKVRPVEDFRAGLPDGMLDSPEPPASLGGTVRLAAAHKVGGGALRHLKGLVRQQVVNIVGKLFGQRDGKLRDVAGQTARRDCQRRGVESNAHLFMLQFPVVVQLRIVVRDPAFVGGVVEPVGGVDQHGRSHAEDFVAVRDAGRNQNLPWPEVARVDGVAVSPGGRFGAEIGEHDLEHVHGGRPAIRLVAMEVESLNDAGIIERGGDLGGFFREVGGQAFTDALHFEEVAPVVRPKRDGRTFHAVDEFRGIMREDDVADTLLALGNGDFDLRNAHATLA